MVANENRSLGVIVLTNGDTTRGDLQSMVVQFAISELASELFDCFESQQSTGLILRPNLINILSIMINVLCFFSLTICQ